MSLLFSWTLRVNILTFGRISHVRVYPRYHHIVGYEPASTELSENLLQGAAVLPHSFWKKEEEVLNLTVFLFVPTHPLQVFQVQSYHAPCGSPQRRTQTPRCCSLSKSLHTNLPATKSVPTNQKRCTSSIRCSRYRESVISIRL